MTNKMKILKEVWDNWANKEWFKYANYENENSNKIIIQANYHPTLEMPQFRIFMGKYPEIQYEVKYPQG
jgi:hypothetical protein